LKIGQHLAKLWERIASCFDSRGRKGTGKYGHIGYNSKLFNPYKLSRFTYHACHYNDFYRATLEVSAADAFSPSLNCRTMRKCKAYFETR